MAPQPRSPAAGLAAGEYQKREGISLFVTSSVLWALYSFLRSPDDYWETILTAIAVGGDVDATAAMAGAIAGARLGPAAIPTQLTPHIHDRGTWKASDTAWAMICGGKRWRL